MFTKTGLLLGVQGGGVQNIGEPKKSATRELTRKTQPPLLESLSLPGHIDDMCKMVNQLDFHAIPNS